MIVNFRGKEALAISNGQRSRLPPDIVSRAKRAFSQIGEARDIFDLRLPSSNHLERLRGKLDGYWSIRINDQWRVMFLWDEEYGDAHNVEIVDYH